MGHVEERSSVHGLVERNLCEEAANLWPVDKQGLPIVRDERNQSEAPDSPVALERRDCRRSQQWYQGIHDEVHVVLFEGPSRKEFDPKPVVSVDCLDARRPRRTRPIWLDVRASEADSRNALKVVDDFIDVQVKDPDQIPFDALCTTLKVDVFGSRIANPDNQAILNSMIESTFTKSAFDLQFPLVPALGNDGPVLPDSSSQADMIEWITKKLPSHTPPTWVGLGADAEETLEKVKAETVYETVEKVSAAIAATTSPS